jgi:hypothetical protein
MEHNETQKNEKRGSTEKTLGDLGQNNKIMRRKKIKKC